MLSLLCYIAIIERHIGEKEEDDKEQLEEEIQEIFMLPGMFKKSVTTKKCKNNPMNASNNMYEQQEYGYDERQEYSYEQEEIIINSLQLEDDNLLFLLFFAYSRETTIVVLICTLSVLTICVL